MYEVKADPARHRLYIRLQGLFSDEETAEASDVVIAAVSKMKRPFDLINDISEFRPLSQGSLAHVRRVADFMANHGIRRSIRIVGRSAIASMQFKRETQEAGYVSYNVASLEEAEALLAQPPRQQTPLPQQKIS